MQTDPSPVTRKANWLPWVGLLLSVVAALSYPLVFYRFPVTRDVPWVSFLLFGLALAALAVGLKRAFARQPAYRGKISAPILTVLSVALLALFSFGVLVGSKNLPASLGAPKVGQKAPDFTLPDASGRQVSLAQLLAEPVGAAARRPQGVLLVFYRGYW
jgi:hypothetical protein